MRILLCGIFAAAAFPATPVFANVCQTDRLACATTMPLGGYCECTKNGKTEDGTVVPGTHRKLNATAGGCGVHPGAPGCK